MGERTNFKPLEVIHAWGPEKPAGTFGRRPRNCGLCPFGEHVDYVNGQAVCRAPDLPIRSVNWDRRVWNWQRPNCSDAYWHLLFWHALDVLGLGPRGPNDDAQAMFLAYLGGDATAALAFADKLQEEHNAEVRAAVAGRPKLPREVLEDFVESVAGDDKARGGLSEEIRAIKYEELVDAACLLLGRVPCQKTNEREDDG